jgi:hypothetical protein
MEKQKHAQKNVHGAQVLVHVSENLSEYKVVVKRKKW